MAVDYDAIRAQWPQLAFLIDDPEVGPILRDAYENPDEWPDWKFQSAIMATSWYRTHNSDARNNLGVQAVDPATYQRRWDRVHNNVLRLAGTLGIGLTGDRSWEIANFAMMNDLDEFEIRKLLVEGDWHLTAGSTEQAVREAYADYFMPMSDAGLKDATKRITEGFWTIDGLRADLAARATELYPQMADTIKSGRTPRQWFEPYRQTIAQYLEINPQTIDPMDPKWRPLFESFDPASKQTRAMTLYETADYVRKMPEWKKTRQARDTSAEYAEMFLREMGAIA